MNDEAMINSSMEAHLHDDVLPNVFIEPQEIEFTEGSVEANRTALWKALGPSLDTLANKLQLPKQKPAEMIDTEYFEFLVDKMYGQNTTTKRQDDDLLKWSIWPSVANETGATNCSLGSQVLLRLLENAGYEVEYGTPGPLTHSIAFAKSGEDYYYLDPTNGIVEKVAETTIVDDIKVHVLKTDNFKCPFGAVPAFPPEYSTVATISNLEALQSENERPEHSDFVTKLAKGFNMQENQHYLAWTKNNLFSEWDKLATGKYWEEERARFGKNVQLLI